MAYDKLVSYLKNQNEYPASIKEKYLVITMLGSKYHITIFRDQWDEYEAVTGLPYHLFHISSDDVSDRCSSYFWVDIYTNRVKKIPRKFFQYNQPTYNFRSSTRSPCPLVKVKPLLKILQRMLNSMSKN